MELLGRYINGNTRNYIYSDGTRVCETDDDEFRFAYEKNEWIIDLHDKYTFDDVFHQVNKYVRNNMSKHEETLFIQEVKSNKRLGKLVAVICSFIKHSK